MARVGNGYNMDPAMLGGVLEPIGLKDLASSLPFPEFTARLQRFHDAIRDVPDEVI